MRTLILVAIVTLMTTLTSAQTLPVPQAITDPKLISSKPNAQVEQNQQSLSIERLYMTRSVGATAWSPDGKYIYFNSVRSGLMQVWRMDADGKNQTQLTNDDYNNWFAHISPDGKWIVCLSFGKDVKPDDHPFYKQLSHR